MVPSKRMVLQQCIVLVPSMVLEPEEIPVPDADDLVIEILTDHMVDFDESALWRQEAN